MKHVMLIFLTATVLGLVGTTHCNAGCNSATQVYDLRSDWSTTQNPNGSWSYRDGQNLLVRNPLPWVGANYSGYQGVWPPIVPAIEKLTGDTPQIYAEADVFQNPWRMGFPAFFFGAGDVILVPGTGCNILWTAPASGIINISGYSWHAGSLSINDICVPIDFEGVIPPWAWWTLTHNGASLSSGDTDTSCDCMRYTPKPFALGSGGSAALQNIPVAAGDQIVLAFTGEVVGVNFTIVLTPDSIDPIRAIEDLAITVVQMNLQNGIANSLDAKLDAALNVLTDINLNNDSAACNSLAAFISAVDAQRGKKITNAQADQLIASAQEIKGCLGCAN